MHCFNQIKIRKAAEYQNFLLKKFCQNIMFLYFHPESFLYTYSKFDDLENYLRDFIVWHNKGKIPISWAYELNLSFEGVRWLKSRYMQGSEKCN